MSKAIRFIVAAAAAAAALATLVVVGTSSTAQAPAGKEFTLSELTRSSTFRFIDNPPRLFRHGRGSVSPGDIATVRTPLVDESGHRAGFLNAACIVTKPGHTFARAMLQCNLGYELKTGHLAAAATVRGEGSRTVSAITGGTGTYEGAGGSVTAVEGTSKSQDTFHLLP
jgi:hypothetical protein